MATNVPAVAPPGAMMATAGLAGGREQSRDGAGVSEERELPGRVGGREPVEHWWWPSTSRGSRSPPVGAGWIADGGDTEQPGDELVVSEPHGGPSIRCFDPVCSA
jgi:hypothetical protein